MLYLGVPLEKARDYISTGCHNPTVPHYSRNTGGGAMNAGLALELALNNGVGRVLKEQLGPLTGDPRTFENFEQLIEAFETQLKAGLRLQMVNKHADFASFGEYPVYCSPQCMIRVWSAVLMTTTAEPLPILPLHWV